MLPGTYKVWGSSWDSKDEHIYSNSADRIAAHTRIAFGIFKNKNEDSMGVGKDQSGNLFMIVADGVGRCENPDEASITASKKIARFLSSQEAPSSEEGVRARLEEALQVAHAHLLTLKSCLTTVEIAYIVNDVVHSLGAGDSQGYLFEPVVGGWKEVMQTPTDSAPLAPGEGIRNYALSEVLGRDPKCASHYVKHALIPGALFLLGTDGMWDNFSFADKRAEALQGLTDLQTIADTFFNIALQQMNFLAGHNDGYGRKYDVLIDGKPGVANAKKLDPFRLLGENGILYETSQDNPIPRLKDIYKADDTTLIGYMHPRTKSAP